MAASEQPEPALKKLDLTIARLRLLLADVAARETMVEAQRHTFRDQREKLVTFALYGDATVDSVLAMLRDVEERTVDTDAGARALHAIRERAEAELESLQLTKSIEEAKVVLAELRTRQEEPEPALGGTARADVQAEIRRLQGMINEASERAARSIEVRGSRHGSW